jgi:hypothetical protein
MDAVVASGIVATNNARIARATCMNSPFDSVAVMNQSTLKNGSRLHPADTRIILFKPWGFDPDSYSRVIASFKIISQMNVWRR